MVRKSCVVIMGCTVGGMASHATLAGLNPGPGYQIQYQVNGANVGAIDRASDSQLAATAFSATQDVKSVGLNTGPVGPTIYTQPALPGGLTFGGGFIATDGTYALTGQTGFPADAQGLFPGRAFLTRLSDGASSELNVPGNYDGTAAGGELYVTAAAGTGSGLSDNGSSGVYQAQRSGGTLTGLNLVIDTGAPSGLVAGDAGGNLAFSLGGVSASLSGNANDLYRLTAGQVASALAAGPTTGLPGAAADKLITGTALSGAVSGFFAAHTPAGGFVFTSLSDLLVAPDGKIIVSLSGILFDSGFNFVGSIGEALLLNVTHTGGDHSASVSGSIFTHDATGSVSLTYRESDGTLWVSDGGNIYGLSLVPEPGAILLLAVGIPLLHRRSVRRKV